MSTLKKTNNKDLCIFVITNLFYIDYNKVTYL